MRKPVIPAAADLFSEQPVTLVFSWVAHLLMAAVAYFGLSAIYCLLQYNPARGDEFYSYAVCTGSSLSTLLGDIKAGMDVSYTHPAALWAAFKLFGHSLYVQRWLSFGIWLLSLGGLYRLFGGITKSGLMQRLLLLSFAFSNFSFFLASDGRFYSLLFLFSIWLAAYIILRLGRGRRIYVLYLAAVQLLGLLTSAGYILMEAAMGVSLIIFLLLRPKDAIRRRAVLSYALSAGIAIGVYVYYFYVKDSISFHIAGVLSDHHESLRTVWQDAVENLSRWLLLPSIPGLNDSESTILFLLPSAVLVIYMLVQRQFILSAAAGVQLLFALGVCCVALLIGKALAAFLLPGWYLWPFRYYAPVAMGMVFLMPLVYGILLRSALYRSLVLLLLMAFVFNSQAYYARYSQKQDAKTKLNSFADGLHKGGLTIRVIQMSPLSYTESQFYGALYCFYPQLRDKLELRYMDDEHPRLVTLRQLQQRRPEVHCYPYNTGITDTAALHQCYLLVNKDDSRYSRYDGAEVPGYPAMKYIVFF